MIDLYPIHGNDKNGLQDITDVAHNRRTPMQAKRTPSSPDTLNILRIDASARREGSVTRRLADALVHELDRRVDGLNVVRRDLADGMPLLDAHWVAANFTDPAERGEEHRLALAHSDALVAEVQAADVLVIATPLYNFGVPASLKAWIDQIARAQLTFRYTEHGPVGLLKGKKAYLLVATGGTAVGGEGDFATPWLRFVLGFMGITDVEVIAADRGMARGEDARLAAEEHLARLLDKQWPTMAEAALRRRPMSERSTTWISATSAPYVKSFPPWAPPTARAFPCAAASAPRPSSTWTPS